jgi:hypothetical protein
LSNRCSPEQGRAEIRRIAGPAAVGIGALPASAFSSVEHPFPLLVKTSWRNVTAASLIEQQIVRLHQAGFIARWSLIRHGDAAICGWRFIGIRWSPAPRHWVRNAAQSTDAIVRPELGYVHFFTGS